MMTDFIYKLNPLITKINQEIVTLLNSTEPLINIVAEHILLAGGKRLRPILFILSGRLVSKEIKTERKLLKLSAALELIHVASLLHDDLVDGAESRRGKIAAYKLFGAAESVLTGDYLMAKAAEIAAGSYNGEFIRHVARALRLMSEGELMQRRRRYQASISSDHYMKIIYRKTAVLMEIASFLGGMVGGVSEEKSSYLADFGSKLGLAFQIVDDCLDYQVEAQQLGKPVGHDLDEGQVTLPFILARNKATNEDKKRFLELGSLISRTNEEWQEVKDLIIKYDGLLAAEKMAASLVDEAIHALNNFAVNCDYHLLKELAYYVVNREI